MTTPELPSTRSFGTLFAVVFALLGGWLAWFRGESLAAMLALTAALLFALAARFLPDRLATLNRAWFAFGLLLGRIVSPLVIGLIFFLLITPVGLVQRAFGRDALGLRKRAVDSYWKPRQPPGPDAASFRNQF